MAPYLAKIPTFQCPSFPNEAQAVDYLMNGWDKYTPSGKTAPMFKITRLRRSSDLVLLTEANGNRMTADFTKHDVWHPSHLPSGSERRICDDQRHRGQVNAVYTDGHVASKHFKLYIVADFQINP